jgi:hypothetical protein
MRAWRLGWEGMTRNDGRFNIEHNDNGLNPVIPGRCEDAAPRNDEDRIAASHYFPSALAIPCQISSLISVAGGLGMMVVGPVRLWQASTSRSTHTSPSV